MKNKRLKIEFEISVPEDVPIDHAYRAARKLNYVVFEEWHLNQEISIFNSISGSGKPVGKIKITPQ